jgi:hypothetical protein
MAELASRPAPQQAASTPSARTDLTPESAGWQALPRFRTETKRTPVRLCPPSSRMSLHNNGC